MPSGIPLYFLLVFQHSRVLMFAPIWGTTGFKAIDAEILGMPFL